MLLRVDDHQDLRLEIIADCRNEHIDVTDAVRTERIFVGRIEPHDERDLVLDGINAVHIDVHSDDFRALSKELPPRRNFQMHPVR